MPQEEKKPSALAGIKFAKKAPAAEAPAAPPEDSYSKKFGQAVSLFESGVLDEAAKIFTELDSEGYSSSECLRYLAIISMRKGDIPSAESLAGKSLAADPANARAVIAGAEINAADGDYLGAIELGKKAIAMEPGEPEFDRKIGGFYLALKSPSKAVQFLNSAAAKYKDPSKIPESLYVMLGEADLLLGDRLSAVQAFFKALAINPKSKKAEEELARMRGEIEAKYKAADAKANPRATNLLDKAMTLYSKNDLEGMQASVEEALKFAPKYYRAHWVLGTIHSMFDRSETAAGEFELAIECYPEHYLPYNNLGIIHANRGEQQKALGLYTESIKRYPFDPIVFKNRADLLFKMKRREEALDDYNTVISLKPEDAALSACYTDRSELLGTMGRRKEAEDGLERAIKLDPSNKRAEKLLAEMKANLVTGFGDVAGMEKLKETLMETIIFPLRRKDLAARYGLAAGGGVLLYGPPGCGKTYIISALAREAKVNFHDVKISDLIGNVAGDPIQLMHQTFDEAIAKAPVILFIDEVDAFGVGREGGISESGRKLTNQFLTEMDEAMKVTDVLVIGATNAPWDIDTALKRPGRFGKVLYVPPPDPDSRKLMLKMYMRDRPHMDDIDFDELAQATDGFSSAEIRARCDEAATYPWKEAMKSGVERPISMSDMRKAVAQKATTIKEWFTKIQEHMEEPGAQEFYSGLFDDLKKYAGIGLFAKPTMTFADVAGMDEVKKSIRTKILEPIKNPKLYKKYGMKAGGGILLYGPPGCGKTYIMKAAAGEGGIGFVTAKLSDILSKYTGEAERNIHNVFETARKNAPCILFFDEIDALGVSREEGISESDKKLVNQLLTEMDGISGGSEGILIVGATNIPWNVDIALRRSGRLGDAIYIPAPDTASREALFKLHTKGKPLAEGMDFAKLAGLTAGYSSADVADVCDKAISTVLEHAMETGQEREVAMEDFLAAIKGKVPTISQWYSLADKELAALPDKDMFKDMMKDLKVAGKVGVMKKGGITFEDVAGMEDVKKQIKAKILGPLKNPELAKRYGVKAGGGILLYGPPGCGKTFIMRAAAGEGGVSFVTAKLSDILGKYEGESEQNVRNLFETARRNSPCILFFDEIDALGISRDEGISASDKKMVNQLLTEMDGIGGGSEGILIVGATNIPWKVDIALRRSGRLGDAIYIPAPDAASREALFKISTKGKPLAKDVDFKKLAAMTEGYVSADLADICDRVFYGVYQEAMETGEEKAADMASFVAEIRKKKPTVKAWYQIAEKELENAPDRDIFEDVFNDIEHFRELEQKKRGEGR